MGAERGEGGVAALRRRRGTQQVSFNDVADHLVDFAQHEPGAAVIVDRLARFLAEVEQVDHDHDVPAERGSTA